MSTKTVQIGDQTEVILTNSKSQKCRILNYSIALLGFLALSFVILTGYYLHKSIPKLKDTSLGYFVGGLTNETLSLRRDPRLHRMKRDHEPNEEKHRRSRHIPARIVEHYLQLLGGIKSGQSITGSATAMNFVNSVENYLGIPPNFTTEEKRRKASKYSQPTSKPMVLTRISRETKHRTKKYHKNKNKQKHPTKSEWKVVNINQELTETTEIPLTQSSSAIYPNQMGTEKSVTDDDIFSDAYPTMITETKKMVDSTFFEETKTAEIMNTEIKGNNTKQSVNDFDNITAPFKMTILSDKYVEQKQSINDFDNITAPFNMTILSDKYEEQNQSAHGSDKITAPSNMTIPSDKYAELNQTSNPKYSLTNKTNLYAINEKESDNTTDGNTSNSTANVDVMQNIGVSKKTINISRLRNDNTTIDKVNKTTPDTTNITNRCTGQECKTVKNNQIPNMAINFLGNNTVTIIIRSKENDEKSQVVNQTETNSSNAALQTFDGRFSNLSLSPNVTQLDTRGREAKTVKSIAPVSNATENKIFKNSSFLQHANVKNSYRYNNNNTLNNITDNRYSSRMAIVDRNTQDVGEIKNSKEESTIRNSTEVVTKKNTTYAAIHNITEGVAGISEINNIAEVSASKNTKEVVAGYNATEGARHNTAEMSAINNTSRTGAINNATDVSAIHSTTKVGARYATAEVSGINNDIEKSARHNSTEMSAVNNETEVGTRHNSTEIGAVNKATEVGARHNSTEIGAVNKATEVGARHNSTEMGAVNNAREVGARFNSTEMGTVNNATKVGARHNSTEMGTANNETEVGARHNSTEMGAVNKATEVGARHNSTEMGTVNNATEVGARHNSTEMGTVNNEIGSAINNTSIVSAIDNTTGADAINKATKMGARHKVGAINNSVEVSAFNNITRGAINATKEVGIVNKTTGEGVTNTTNGMGAINNITNLHNKSLYQTKTGTTNKNNVTTSTKLPIKTYTRINTTLYNSTTRILNINKFKQDIINASVTSKGFGLLLNLTKPNMSQNPMNKNITRNLILKTLLNEEASIKTTKEPGLNLHNVNNTLKQDSNKQKNSKLNLTKTSTQRNLTVISYISSQNEPYSKIIKENNNDYSDNLVATSNHSKDSEHHTSDQILNKNGTISNHIFPPERSTNPQLTINTTGRFQVNKKLNKSGTKKYKIRTIPTLDSKNSWFNGKNKTRYNNSNTLSLLPTHLTKVFSYANDKIQKQDNISNPTEQFLITKPVNQETYNKTKTILGTSNIPKNNNISSKKSNTTTEMNFNIDLGTDSNEMDEIDDMIPTSKVTLIHPKSDKMATNKPSTIRPAHTTPSMTLSTIVSTTENTDTVELQKNRKSDSKEITESSYTEQVKTTIKEPKKQPTQGTTSFNKENTDEDLTEKVDQELTQLTKTTSNPSSKENSEGPTAHYKDSGNTKTLSSTNTASPLLTKYVVSQVTSKQQPKAESKTGINTSDRVNSHYKNIHKSRKKYQSTKTPSINIEQEEVSPKPTILTQNSTSEADKRNLRTVPESMYRSKKNHSSEGLKWSVQFNSSTVFTVSPVTKLTSKSYPNVEQKPTKSVLMNPQPNLDSKKQKSTESWTADLGDAQSEFKIHTTNQAAEGKTSFPTQKISSRTEQNEHNNTLPTSEVSRATIKSTAKPTKNKTNYVNFTVQKTTESSDTNKKHIGNGLKFQLSLNDTKVSSIKSLETKESNDMETEPTSTFPTTSQVRSSKIKSITISSKTEIEENKISGRAEQNAHNNILPTSEVSRVIIKPTAKTAKNKTKQTIQKSTESSHTNKKRIGNGLKFQLSLNDTKTSTVKQSETKESNDMETKSTSIFPTTSPVTSSKIKITTILSKTKIEERKISSRTEQNERNNILPTSEISRVIEKSTAKPTKNKRKDVNFTMQKTTEHSHTNKKHIGNGLKFQLSLNNTKVSTVKQLETTESTNMETELTSTFPTTSPTISSKIKSTPISSKTRIGEKLLKPSMTEDLEDFFDTVATEPITYSFEKSIISTINTKEKLLNTTMNKFMSYTDNNVNTKSKIILEKFNEMEKNAEIDHQSASPLIVSSTATLTKSKNQNRLMRNTPTMKTTERHPVIFTERSTDSGKGKKGMTKETSSLIISKRDASTEETFESKTVSPRKYQTKPVKYLTDTMQLTKNKSYSTSLLKNITYHKRKLDLPSKSSTTSTTPLSTINNMKGNISKDNLKIDNITQVNLKVRNYTSKLLSGSMSFKTMVYTPPVSETTSNTVTSKSVSETTIPNTIFEESKNKWQHFVNISMPNSLNKTTEAKRKIVQILTDNNRQEKMKDVGPAVVKYLKELLNSVEDKETVTPKQIETTSLPMYKLDWNCRPDSTSWSTAYIIGMSRFLQGHQIKCQKHEFLQKFSLRDNKHEFFPLFRYEFVCCQIALHKFNN